MTRHLSTDELGRALAVRDLTDPTHGRHAMQALLQDVVDALGHAWPDAIPRVHRRPPLVAVCDNYDRLGYAADDVTREARYSRYASPTVMLRSHTSADVPGVLRGYAGAVRPVDDLLVLPGLAYRRDAVDRTHVGEPHQVDLWRLRSVPGTDAAGLEEMVGVLVEAVLPGAEWRTTPASHPYTAHGRQVDVRHEGEWLELAECGLIAAHVLAGAGLDPDGWSGLALGMGLDRALMLRKGVPDIRYLRADEPRIAVQMQDLSPWRPVSMLPAVRRDLSVVVDDVTDDETLGDSVRVALGRRVADVESVHVVARTPYDALPEAARARLGLVPGQSNALVRLVLRPLERTLTDAEANALRNDVYRAVHVGPRLELA